MFELSSKIHVVFIQVLLPKRTFNEAGLTRVPTKHSIVDT